MLAGGSRLLGTPQTLGIHVCWTGDEKCVESCRMTLASQSEHSTRSSPGQHAPRTQFTIVAGDESNARHRLHAF